MSIDDLGYDEQEIYKLIKNKPGCNYDYLYKQGSFEKARLSLLIHKLTQLCLIYKEKECYFATNVSEEDVRMHKEKIAREAEAKLSMVAEQMARAAKTTPPVAIPVVHGPSKAAPLEENGNVDKKEGVIPPKAVETPAAVSKPPVSTAFGNIRKSTNRGIVAYFFYSRRGDGNAYSRENLKKEFANLKNPLTADINPVLQMMAYEGILRAVNPGERPVFYVWNNKFDYPFPVKDPSDALLLKMKDGAPQVVEQPKPEFKIKKEPVEPKPEPKSDAPAVSTTLPMESSMRPNLTAFPITKAPPVITDPAILMLDIRIASLENELKELRALRGRINI